MDKDNREQAAVRDFDSGLNCAQAVLSAFSADLELDRDLARRIASGFGAGMGRLQQTCGAVTGAFMVIGLYCGREDSGCNDKDKIYSLIRTFDERFKKLNHGTTECRTLLNCDLRTDEGQMYFYENDLGGKICQMCVKSSVQILRELLGIE